MAVLDGHFLAHLALILRFDRYMADYFGRCVNVDWLEIYAQEDNMSYPMNAEFFRNHGLEVIERDYGTRVYKEMFTILDENHNGFIEIRRNPASGSSEFTGLSELSCHLRFCNRSCYSNTAVRDMADFMVRWGYIFERIYRIDICYDFIYFDSGDRPGAFIRRYLDGKFSKVNQCKIRAIGSDNWDSFDWESVSWGSPTSMVSTKIYNKTKELQATGNKKPWILQAWFESGLVQDPLRLPDVWRIEFSLKSTVRNWIVIEDTRRKKHKKHAVPHRLELFDGRDRIWQRFEELAYHYFRFAKREETGQVDSDGFPIYKRKDLCPDKILFKFNTNRTFYQVAGLPNESRSDDKDRVLRMHLNIYREKHADPDIRRSIDIILNNLDRDRMRRITVHGWAHEIEAIRLAIATRTGWDYQRVIEKAEEIHRLIEEKQIW